MKLKNSKDGISFAEALASPASIVFHSERIDKFQKFCASLLQGNVHELWAKVRSLCKSKDALLFVGLMIVHKPFLQILHKITTLVLGQKESDGRFRTYKHSIWKYLQKPVLWSIWFIPFVYVVDIISLTLHHFGCYFHLKGDVARLLCTIYDAFICGSLAVTIKDWILDRRTRDVNKRRDQVREKTVDELSNILIWTLMFGFCLEAMSLEFGFALGSIFSVVGIGSASVVLALRGTMENVIGGLLLKFQDKIRVGEVVTIPGIGKKGGYEEGVVEEVTYLATSIRRKDNSVAVIPNNVFTKGETINWSRTPYRLFKTTVTVSIKDYNVLGDLISSIKTRISELDGGEIMYRDLLVSATGFKANSVDISIEAHLKTSDSQGAALLTTNVIRAVAEVVQMQGGGSTKKD